MTESWLKPEIQDSELTVHTPGYSIFRQDRKDRIRGGVCLFLRNDLSGDILSSYCNSVCELLVVKVHQINTIVAVVYRPPDTNLAEFTPVIQHLSEIFEDLEAPRPNIVVLGDFNFPSSVIKWNLFNDMILPCIAGIRSSSENEGVLVRQQAGRFCDLAKNFHLNQLVSEPTRGDEILDLIWCSNPDLVTDIDVIPCATMSDHSTIIGSTSFSLCKEVTYERQFLLDSGKRLHRLDFFNAPWAQLRVRLKNVDWTKVGNAARQDVTAAHALFLETLLPILEELVPFKIPATKIGKRKVDKQRRNIWRKLSRVRKQISACQSAVKVTTLLYKQHALESRLKKSYEEQSWETEKKVVNSMRTNPKAFFAYSRARQKTKARVGPFLDPETGIPNSNPNFSAKLLSAQYSSVFTPPRPEFTVSDPNQFFNAGPTPTGTSPMLSDIEFSESDIEMACHELDSASAPGPDGIPAVLLKTLSKELSHPLYTLWRGSVDQGVIPADLLLVLISPIHKGGSRGTPANYRPVALTSHITKVFERVIRRRLVDYLEQNSFLPEEQHGFRSKRSCLTQLLAFWDRIIEKMEEGNGVDVIYTDFAKAFDKCETGVLLHKLRQCGVRHKVGRWIAAFLDPNVRKQAVGVDGCLSSLESVISGVPQGTVLGPCLFLIHILDIASGLSEKTYASSFADDTRVQRAIQSYEDCEILQSDLNEMYKWADQAGMEFNSNKFELLRFWSDKSYAPDFQYAAPDGTIIKEKSGLRDLGISVNTDMTFSSQIESAVQSGSKVVGWVLRTFRARSRYLMLLVFRSLVQPRLDYCSQLWSPRDQKSINLIESVQKHFISQIKCPKLKNLNYWEKLSELRVYSQERRRERYQICFLWKLSQGMVEGFTIKWQWSDRRGRLAVPNGVSKNAPNSVRKARENFLNVHGAKLFNILPKSLRNEDCGDFELFKNHLDLFLAQIPDQPTVSGLVRAASSNSLLDQVPLVNDLDLN